MTTIETLNYVNIGCIWFYALILVFVVSRMDYGIKECTYTFYKSVISLFKYKSECGTYLKSNKFYLVAIFLFFVLVILSLGLLSQAYSGMIRIRTELTVSMSIINFILTPLIILIMFFKLMGLISFINNNKH